MSTNGMTSWAVDLKDVGAIYPFQGWEVLHGHPRIYLLDRLAHYPDAPGKCRRLQPIWRPTGAATKPGQRSIATSKRLISSSGRARKKARYGQRLDGPDLLADYQFAA